LNCGNCWIHTDAVACFVVKFYVIHEESRPTVARAAAARASAAITHGWLYYGSHASSIVKKSIQRNQNLTFLRKSWKPVQILMKKRKLS